MRGGTIKDLHSRRVQTVLHLARRGASLDVIGQAVGGVSRERARQIINEIETIHGLAIYQHRENWLTPQRVAKMLQCPPSFVHQQVKTGQAELINGRLRVGAPYILTLRGVEQVRLKLQQAKNRSCVNCGQEFQVENPFSRQKFCTKAACRRSQSSYVTKSPVNYSVGWLSRMREKLSRHTLPASETWLTYTKARTLTQLTSSQFMHLARTQSLTTRPNPKRRWRGKRARLYAKSELMIVRACWRQVQRGRQAA